MADWIERDALLEILCSDCAEYSDGCNNKYGRFAEYITIKQIPKITDEAIREYLKEIGDS